MTWIWVLMTLVVLGGTAAVAVGYGGSMRRAYPDRPDVRLPADRPLVAEDLAHVRYSVVLRGYRMDEVDDVMHRLAEELAERDARLEWYERSVRHAVAADGGAAADGSQGTASAGPPPDGRVAGQ